VSFASLLVTDTSITAQDKVTRIPSFNECDRAKDKDKVKLFLSRIDEEIAGLTDTYPQLVDWREGLEEKDQQIRGKEITDNSMSYSHAMTRTKSPNYRDWYKENGCQILIRVYTECEAARVQGPGVKTQLFGLKMGDRYVAASVITEKPEVPELEQKVTDIIRKHALEMGRIWAK